MLLCILENTIEISYFSFWKISLILQYTVLVHLSNVADLEVLYVYVFSLDL